MAGVQWSDGKMHGSIEAKNSMMHDTKDTRLIHGHSNPDIDLAKTPNNMSYRGLTYKEKCARYDELMDKVRIKRKSSGKNTNVTLQNINILGESKTTLKEMKLSIDEYCEDIIVR